MPEKLQPQQKIEERKDAEKEVMEQTKSQLSQLNQFYSLIQNISQATSGAVKSLSAAISSFLLGGAAEADEAHTKTGRISGSVKHLTGSPLQSPGYGFKGSVSIDRTSSLFQSLPERAKKNFDSIEQGLNEVAKRLNINAPALFAVIYSESRFDPGAVEVGGYGGKGLLQFTGETQKLLKGNFDIPSQIKAVEAYFSQRPDQLKNMENARDLKLLTRWGPHVKLESARAAKKVYDNEHFNTAWSAIRSAI